MCKSHGDRNQSHDSVEKSMDHSRAMSGAHLSTPSQSTMAHWRKKKPGLPQKSAKRLASGRLSLSRGTPVAGRRDFSEVSSVHPVPPYEPLNGTICARIPTPRPPSRFSASLSTRHRSRASTAEAGIYPCFTVQRIPALFFALSRSSTTSPRQNRAYTPIRIQWTRYKVERYTPDIFNTLPQDHTLVRLDHTVTVAVLVIHRLLFLRGFWAGTGVGVGRSGATSRQE